MKKIYLLRTVILFITALLISGTSRAAITNPVGFDLSLGNYSMTNWPLASPAGTYPANMIFHWFSSLTTTPTGNDGTFNMNCVYNLSSGPRLEGQDANGFSFINTSSAQSNACASGQGGFCGDAVLGLITTGRTNIQVSWTSSTLVLGDGLPTPRVWNVRLQYRIGAAGTYTDVPGPVEYVAVTAAANLNQNVTLTGTLPAACEHQPLVFVRWLYFESAANSGGTRPKIKIDDISVTSNPGYLTIANQVNLNALNAIQPAPSPAGTFTLSGAALTGSSATVQFSPATTNFELSTNNVNFFPSLSLPVAGGIITGQPVTVYVRQSNTAPLGTNSATVQASATNAANQTVGVSGTVSVPSPLIIPSVASLTGFTAIQPNPSPSQNFFVNANNLVANVSATAPAGYEISLNNISWFPSLNLPQSGGTLIGQPVYIYTRISSAAPLGPVSGNISFTSTNATTQNVSVNGSVIVPPPVITTTGLVPGGPFNAVIGNASSAQTFTVSGNNLVGSVTITPPANYELSLNNISYTPTLVIAQSGGVLPGQPITVYVRIASTSPGGPQNGNIAFTSTNATTQNIAVTGNVTVPTISTTGSLNIFSTMSGNPSAPQTLTLNGSNLIGDVTVTAPAGFEISTDNISYNNSILLLQVGGNLVGQPLTLYIRLKASAAGWQQGNLQMTSASAANVNILLRGNANLPFTNGNIAVARVGDSIATLVNTGSTVFIDEYTPAGVRVQSIVLPYNSAGNNLITSGVATSEGFVTRSVNGQYLAIAGYNRPVGGTGSLSGTTSAAVNRIVGLVKYDGSVDVSTSLADAGNTGNSRSAFTTDGTNIWIGCSTDGVRYTTVSSNTSTQVSTTSTNVRDFNFAEYGGGIGQLFISSGSGSTRVATVGIGAPTTTGNTITNVPGPVLSSPYEYFFADLSPSVPGVDVMYVADDAIGLVRFSLVAGTWVQDGVIGTPADKYRGIAGTVDNNTGIMTLYAVRGFDGVATGNGGDIVSFTDNMGYSPITFTAPAVNVLVSAGTNNKISYRSVALVPYNTTCSGSTVTWTGNASSNTKLPSNWCGGVLPTTGDDVFIDPNGPINRPIVDSTGNNAHNLTVNAGGILKFLGGGAYNLTGNIVNNGTFNSNAGSLTFSGGSAQASPALHVANLTMNGSSLNPSGNIQVDTSLSMMSGDIMLGNDTITLGTSTALLGTLNHTSGDIYGYMKRWFNGTNTGSSGLFPFGFGGNDRFITVEYSQAPISGGSLTGHYYANTNRPFTLNNNSQLFINNVAPCTGTFEVLYLDTNMWKIVPTDGFPNTGSPVNDGLYDVTIAAENLNNYTNVCEITALKSDDDINFVENGTHVATTLSGATVIAKRTAASGWSDWTYAGSEHNPLLIKLLSLDGRKLNNNQCQLDWKANSDNDNEVMVLQHSADGIKYADINTQQAHIGTHDYRYIDNQPANGRNLYRLAIKDINGSVTYSNTIVVNMSGSGLELVSIAPNIISGNATVHMANNEATAATMRIYDAMGRIVITEPLQLNNGNTFFQLNVDALQTGTYMLQVLTPNSQMVQQRFIKQ